MKSLLWLWIAGVLSVFGLGALIVGLWMERRRDKALREQLKRDGCWPLQDASKKKGSP